VANQYSRLKDRAPAGPGTRCAAHPSDSRDPTPGTADYPSRPTPRPGIKHADAPVRLGEREGPAPRKKRAEREGPAPRKKRAEREGPAPRKKKSSPLARKKALTSQFCTL